MEASIIIATYNRADVLEKCLEALSKQVFKGVFEVVIINDGGTDKTESVVQKFGKKLKIVYLKQKNSGQGIARNTGIKEARGEVTIFINDDIIVEENFLEEHLKLHKNNPEINFAVLGFIDWHPEIEVSTFMKWLTNGSNILGKFGGHQFAFEKLEGKKYADFNFFYTSNISLKTALLKKEAFDTSFDCYGWEDVELGYRLEKKCGLKIRYNKKALGYHHHVINLKSFEKRMKMIGRGIKIFDRIHPELKKAPSKLKLIIFKLLSLPPALFLLKILKNKNGGIASDFYFYALSKKYFLKGYYEK